MRAVLYASELRGILCQRSVHVAIASCLVFFSICLMVWGSSSGLCTATWIASNASCLTLQKPTKGMDLGSHSSSMFMFG